MISNDKFRIAVLQYDLVTGDPEANSEKITRLIREKSDQNVDLFLLPEVCLSGFNGAETVVPFEESDPMIQQFATLAKESRAHILGGFRVQEEGSHYNRALLLNEGGVVGRYDKRRLFSYWNEQKLFSSGKHAATFDVGGVSVAPFICYELRFPELFRMQAGVQVMPVLANWPEARRHHWMTLLRARAIENQCYVIGVNRIGDVGSTHFAGDSVVVGPKGETILSLSDREACEVVELDLGALEMYRQEFPVLEDIAP